MAQPNLKKSTLILIIIHSNNASLPLEQKTNSIRYYLTTYIKPIVNPVIYLHLLLSGSVPGRLYGTAKTYKTECLLRQPLPWFKRLNIILQNGSILKLNFISR